MKSRTTKFGPSTVLIALLVLAVGNPAVAQSDIPGTEDLGNEEEEAEGQDAASEPVSGEAEGEETEQQESSLPDRSEDDPMYWAEMREVYAMQQRAFLKQGRFAATLYGGLIPNNIFEQYFPIGARVNYYLLENIGLEASSSFNFSRSTQLNAIVEDEQGIGAQNRPLIGDTQVSHTTAGVKWSPVYGKFSFYEDRLFYFDMFVFGGAGMVVSQTQTEYGPPEQTVSTTVKPEGVLGAGLAVYAGQHAGLRLDYRQFVFQKVDPPGGVANPSEVSLGFSWFF